ncbi:serine/threonine-protein phosphatase [Aureococcus anophagefferens]|uniref:Serine/threonine-protein phosphatase n=1 Tax=Aureococcus anophagefferens TaxID=44056 RepID=A0ABR1G5H8_AURAN
MAYRFLRTLHGLAPVAGLGAAAVGGATALSEPWKSVKPPVQRRLTAVSDATIEAQLFVPAVPYPQWDYNWDHRDFDSHGKRRKPAWPAPLARGAATSSSCATASTRSASSTTRSAS